MIETIESDGFLTLHFETVPGLSVGISTIAVSLLEFEKLAREIAARTDPFVRFEMTLERTEEGSLRFLTNLRSIIPYKRLKELAYAITLALIIQPVVEDRVRPILEEYGLVDPSMSDDDVKRISDAVVNAMKDEDIQRARNGFYNAVEADPAITGVGTIADHTSRKPEIIVRRPDFPQMALAAESPADLEAVQREVPSEVTLTLEVPVLRKSSKAKWIFRREGNKLSASLKDEEFVASALSGNLGIPLIEGVEFDVILVEHQEFKDGVWHTKGHSVRKVIDWRSPPTQGPLPFPESSKN